MKLSAITLAGFKTFAARTEVRFEPGLTAIVGPNGSGKSNIVDAFRWVLGETQARDLRGRRMEEVIYAGGARRPRAAVAEVTLQIDNVDRALPVDYAEVAIRRQVDRSGQSDYFLNGGRVRRRDVLDLLGSTGLTVDSYSIVQQSDIEAIVTCSPEQRRVLVEEAAQVRTVKARRSEATERLRELAQNLARLEDLRAEIVPRLEVLRLQAEAAREAAAASRRLALLRGSVAWEAWREARDAHRRARTQAQLLERRLLEAMAEASAAEDRFRAARGELQAAQDRRVNRQQALGELRLALAAREHELALARERADGLRAVIAGAAGEDAELAARLDGVRQRAGEVAEELRQAREAMAALPSPPALAPAPDPALAAQAAKAAVQARRDAESRSARAGALAARVQLLEETIDSLRRQLGGDRSDIAELEAAAAAAAGKATAAAADEAELSRRQAELEAIDRLSPEASGGLRRVADVIIAEPGYEAALAAALGSLLDAWAAPDAATAIAAAHKGTGQRTVLFPGRSFQRRHGSLFEHVHCEPGYAALAGDLLGDIVVGPGKEPWVSREGEYREPGLVRRGEDPRTAAAARRAAIRQQVEALRSRAEAAGARVVEARASATARARLDSIEMELESARREQAEVQARLPDAERAAASAEAAAATVAAELAAAERQAAEQRAEARRLELEIAGRRERIRDLDREQQALAREAEALMATREARATRSQGAIARIRALEAALPGLEKAVSSHRGRLAAEESSAPEEDAELAEAAKRLVALEEARVDARLKSTTLESNLKLLQREEELAGARMEQLRAEMPAGTPEEVPGGRAREREMRALEKRLQEIGPTNPLAEPERSELEARYTTLAEQLDDLAAARRDLDELVFRLQQEEDSRYDAVFGAVAANFQEYFAELSGGGRATLRHAAGADGPRSGVEILVQPPRKRLQNVTLLSSGERSLTALALVVALEQVNPSPFVILDEVDAALDDANVARFTALLQRLGRKRQFLVVTHNHATMAAAATLYGVHLDESGASHLVSVRLDGMKEQGAPAAAAS